MVLKLNKIACVASLLVGAYFFIACFESPKIFPEKSASMKHAIQVGSVVKVAVKEDVQGIVTASVSKDSTMTQVVEASKSGAISGATLSLPPGSLALDTEISIEEGASIASTVVASELQLNQAVEPASPAVVVQSTTDADAAQPFTLAIPMSGSVGLRLAGIDPKKLAIIYRVIQYGNGGINVVGIIPYKELTIQNGNLVTFETRYFGSYQVAMVETAIEERVETRTETQILTKVEEKKLAPIEWSMGSPTSDANARTAEFSFSVAGFGGAVSCAVIIDQEKASPWNFTTAIGTDTSYIASAVSDAEHTIYAFFECSDQNGRIASSPWSDGVTLPAKPEQSTGTSTETGTGTEGSIEPLTILSSEPASGAIGVEVGRTAIRVVFSRQVNTTTVNGDANNPNFIVTGPYGTSVAGTIGPADSNQEIIQFVPTENLWLNATYTVTVKAGISDTGTAGGTTQLASDYTFNFTTRDGGWDVGEATLFSSGMQDFPTIKINDEGKAVYVGKCGQYNVTNCFKASYFAGTSWENVTQLGMDNTFMIKDSISIDQDGKARVVWAVNGNLQSRVHQASLSVWDTEASLASSIYTSSIAGSGNGSFLLGWSSFQTSYFLNSGWVVNGAWSSSYLPNNINPDTFSMIGAVSTGVNSSGKAFLVGTGDSGGNAYYYGGNAWSAKSVLSSIDCSATIDSQIDDSGRVLLSWKKYSVNTPYGYYAYVAKYDNGWKDSVQLSLLDNSAPILAMASGTGEAAVSFKSGNAITVKQHSPDPTIPWNASAWPTVHMIIAPEKELFDLQASPRGIFSLLYGSSDTLNVAFYNKKLGTWVDSQVSSLSSPAIVEQKSLLLDDVGNLIVAWNEQPSAGTILCRRATYDSVGGGFTWSPPLEYGPASCASAASGAYINSIGMAHNGRGAAILFWVESVSGPTYSTKAKGFR